MPSIKYCIFLRKPSWPASCPKMNETLIRRRFERCLIRSFTTAHRFRDICFYSSILPPYLFKAKPTERLMPLVYKHISKGGIHKALATFQGQNAADISYEFHQICRTQGQSSLSTKFHAMSPTMRAARSAAAIN